MNDQTITCPHCHKEIPLSEAISAKVTTQLQAEQKHQHAEIERQKAELEKEKAAVKNEKQSMEKIIEEQVKQKEQTWKQEAEKNARKSIEIEIKDMESQKVEMEKKLEAATNNELQLRKEKRELEEQKKNLDLELERKMDAERKLIVEKTRQETSDENRLKIAEKEKTIEMMQRTIEDLKRQSEQGSMQIQGEVQEEDLKSYLQNHFPLDLIEDVPTGVNGADLVHTVNSQFGERCGVILWESKNTKTWSAEWIKKLKHDQTACNADLCILVSKTVPDTIQGCGSIDDVWVVEYHCMLPLVLALRNHLIEVQQLRRSIVGKGEKMEFLYSYLSGTQFKLRMESIVNAFMAMSTELDSEKRYMQKNWARRSKEIENVVSNTTGLYGDLQGIIGAAALPVISALELPESTE